MEKKKGSKTLFTMVATMISAAVLLAGCGSTGTNSENTGEGETIKFPTSNLEVIVPYSAGGGTDTSGRIITSVLEKEIGKSVVVINKPGAGGDVGMGEMQRAKADGHHLGFISFPDNAIMAGYKETSYKNSDFIYLASFTRSPNVLIVKKDSKFSTLDELINYAKEHPGEITVSVSGDAHTYNAIQLEKEAGIDLSPVMFSGGGKNLNAVVGGHVEASIITLQFAKPAMEQGAKVIAIASEERAEGLPDVPTFKELGYDVEATTSRILTAPKDTPKEVVDKLVEVLDKVGQDETLKTKITEMGEVYHFVSGAELETYLTERNNMIEEMVKENKDAFTTN